MPDFPLRVVDALAPDFDPEVRTILRPGGTLRTRDGRLRRLPRYFYEVPNWDVALETPLSRNFEVWEFLNVDVREAERLRKGWPRYLPCAVTLLAAHLELLRAEVKTYIHVAANGGYRSPGHTLSQGHASTHCWGTAANLYRIGDDWLDEERCIAKYAEVVQKLMPGVFVRPYGHGPAQADDHLHLDLGWTVTVPYGTQGEAEEDEGEPAPEALRENEDDVTETAEVGA